MSQIKYEDASDKLLAIWKALLRKELTIEKAYEILNNSQFIKIATYTSSLRLNNILVQMAKSEDMDNAYVFSTLVVYHANLLSNSDRNEESILLYNATELIFEKYKSDLDVAICKLNRSKPLTNIGRELEAIDDCNEAERIFQKHGLELEVAKCQSFRGIILRNLRRYQEALVEYNKAEMFFNKNGKEVDVAACQMNQGNALNNLKRYQEALTEYNKAEIIFQKYGKELGVASCQMNRTNILEYFGRHKEAMVECNKAEITFQKYGKEVDVAKCQMNRTVILTCIRRYQEAIVECDKAEIIFQKYGKEVDVASCQINRTDILEYFGRYQEAMVECDKAEITFQKYGKEVYVAKCQMSRTKILTCISRYQEAMVECDKAEAIFEKYGEKLDASECQMRRVIVLMFLERYQEALIEYDKAESNIEKYGSDLDLAEWLKARTGVLRFRGLYQKAIEECDKAEIIFQKYGKEVDVASCQMNRADVLNSIGRYQEALIEYDKAKNVFEKLGVEVMVAKCQLNRAVVSNSIGRYQEALIEYDKAENVFEKLGVEVSVISCQFNRGASLRNIGLNQEALIEFDKAEHGFEKHRMEVFVAMCQVARSNILIEMKLYNEAMAGYYKAKSIFERYGPYKDLAICNMSIAKALEDMGCHKEAISIYQQINIDHLVYDNLWYYHLLYGVTLWQDAKKREALEHFIQGRRALHRARQIAIVDETTLGFAKKRDSLIHISVNTALEEKNFSIAFEAMQDGKASIIGDLMRRKEYSTILESAEFINARERLCVALLNEKDTSIIHQLARTYLKLWHIDQYNAKVPQSQQQNSKSLEKLNSLQQIQHTLPNDWALLDFWVSNVEYVNVFVIMRSEVKIVVLPVSIQNKEIQNALCDLINWVKTGKAGRPDSLELFYDKLFVPLKPDLQGIKGLYLVPHDYLHFIPMHACCNEEGRYLSDEFEIAYLPSSSLLPKLSPSMYYGKMLSIANPGKQSPSTLPFSEWEVEELLRKLKLPQHQLWIGTEATIEKTKMWYQTPLVHFTCHGSSDTEFAPISHLVLADDLLLMHDIINRQPPLLEGSLIILNGCMTGVRDWTAIDEGFGLMSAFLLRGASLVLATQWSVTDLCSAEMVITFLTELVKNGKNPTDALRSAQIRARNITVEEVEACCEELLRTKFPAEDFPYEAEKLSNQAKRACLKASDMKGAMHYAKFEANALRAVGMRVKADRIESSTREIKQHKDARLKKTKVLMYDHPVYWSAFQLVGRVT